jgi:hypothetical protein
MTEEVHKHYHLWPTDPHGNCSVMGCVSIALICGLIILLAWMDKLPW